MTFDDIVKQAFLEELGNIYASRGEEVPKLASDPRIDAMLKEARVMKFLREGAEAVGGAIAKPFKAVHKKVSPAQRELTKYKNLGVGDAAEEALKKQNPLRQAEAWGKAQRHTPAQRMSAARRASIDPVERSMLQVKGDKASKLKQIADVQKATEQIGGTSRAGRMVGSAVEGGAAHARHHPIGMMINPLGVPIGGAMEGATRQAGREMMAGARQMTKKRLQKVAPSVGPAGEVAPMSGLPGALMRAGRKTKEHAGKVGTATEIGTLAGAGTALHAPLSGAAIVGGKVLGGASAAAPALAETAQHGLSHLGGAADVIGHGVQDVVGMATKKVPALASKGVAAVKGLGSRMMGRAPQMVGA